MREVALGQYYPVKSVVHRLDPRIKLIMMVLYIVMIFFITTFIGYGIVLLFLLLTVALSRVPLLKVLKSLKVIIVLVIFTVIMSLLFYNGQAEDLIWSWGINKNLPRGTFERRHVWRSGLCSCFRADDAYVYHHAGGAYRRA